MSKEIAANEIQDFKGLYPKQLWSLFFTEMWERFCFYGMRGVLTIFMAGQLLYTDKDANLKYGAIQAFVYAFTFIGGICADKVLGFRKSLFFGGIIMILGNLIIAMSPKEFFYIGITLSIIGTGFFKPNISSMVGDLYREGDSRRDAGFSLFYAGINVGALLGGIVCVYLGKYVSWSACFMAAAAVMIMGVGTFAFTQRNLGTIGLSPLLHIDSSKRKMREMLVYIGALLTIPCILLMIQNTQYTDYFMYTIGPLAVLYFIYETMNTEGSGAKKKLIAAFIFIIFSIIFWAFFEQSGGSLALVAEKNLSFSLLGLHVDPNAVNNASNSLFVIIFAPLIGILWAAMAVRKIEPNSVIKFGLGFLFLAAAFYVFYSLIHYANAEGISSLNVFTFAYFVITFGELCLSPIGLSLMTKLSPKRLGGMMMGMWFLASAYGQYAAGLLGANMASPDKDALPLVKLQGYTSGYLQLAQYALVAGALLIALSWMVRKLMQDVK